MKWSEREDKLFIKAWNSTAYDRQRLIEVFQRSWSSLENRGARLGQPKRWVVEERARYEAIQKALKEDHIL